MKQKRGLKSFLNIETLIILIIAGCLMFLNIFTVSKLNELENAGKDSVFLIDNISFDDQEAFAEEINSYLGESCKMIELYDNNFNVIFQIQFSGDSIKTNDIREYAALVNIINTNPEGQTSISINGMEQEVYFRWVKNEAGEDRLLLVYSAIKEVEGLWLFSFVCWMIMILVFVLLIRLHSNRYNEQIKEYSRLTNYLRNNE